MVQIDMQQDRALRLRRAFFGPQTRVLNPLIKRIAGGRVLPLLGIVYHTGRRSGRSYVSPVMMGRTSAAFVIPLTFGAETDWCRNVLTAGRCRIKWNGRTYEADSPELVDDVSLGRADVYEAFWVVPRSLLRMMGTHQFLRLRVVDLAA